jgi:hypothetical protein
MGLLKKFAALEGVDEVADKLALEIRQRRAAGEQEFWVGFTQKEIRGRMASATSLAPLVRRKLEKAGHRIVKVEGGSFGDDVRFLVRA